MIALCVPLALVAAWLAVRRSPWVHTRVPGPFGDLLVTVVLWLSWVAVSTEVLSLVTLVGAPGLAVSQIVFAAGGIAWARHGRDMEAGPRTAGTWLDEDGLATRTAQALLVGLVVATFAIGVIGQVTTPDSMTYHLPRVLHWLQNGNVGPYEAIVGRQLWQPPLPGYLLLPVMALTESDDHVWLLQWVGYVVSILLVVRLTWQVGGRGSAQRWAAVLAATVPLALLQATTAQNDLLATVITLCCVSLVLGDRADGRGPAWLLLIGASFGVAVLMKGSLWPLIACLGVYLGVQRLRAGGVRAASPLAAAAAVALVLAGPFLARNLGAYANPAGPSDVAQYATAHPPTVVSNVLRNGALVLVTPWDAVNDRVEDVTRGAHTIVGADPDDPRGMLHDTFALPGWWSGESTAGAPVHALLLLVAGLGLLVDRRISLREPVGHLAVLVGVAFVVLSAMFPWMRWNVRLVLPLLLMSVPVAAIWVERLRAPWSVAVRSTTTLLAVALGIAVLLFPAGTDTLGSDSKLSLSDGAELRARNPAHIKRWFDAFRSDPSSDCPVVGLIGDEAAKEYLVWWVAHDHRGWGNVTVLPSMTGHFTGDPEPCAVVAMQRGELTPPTVDGVVWQLVWAERGYAVYRRGGSATAGGSGPAP